MSTTTRYLTECRYCARYRRACGRPHTEATRSDWGRNWAGEQPATGALEALTQALVDSGLDADEAAYWVRKGASNSAVLSLPNAYEGGPEQAQDLVLWIDDTDYVLTVRGWSGVTLSTARLSGAGRDHMAALIIDNAIQTALDA